MLHNYFYLKRPWHRDVASSCVRTDEQTRGKYPWIFRHTGAAPNWDHLGASNQGERSYPTHQVLGGRENESKYTVLFLCRSFFNIPFINIYFFTCGLNFLRILQIVKTYSFLYLLKELKQRDSAWHEFGFLETNSFSINVCALFPVCQKQKMAQFLRNGAGGFELLEWGRPTTEFWFRACVACRAVCPGESHKLPGCVWRADEISAKTATNQVSAQLRIYVIVCPLHILLCYARWQGAKFFHIGMSLSDIDVKPILSFVVADVNRDVLKARRR